MREPELIVAVEDGDVARVDALLAAGADPETTNRHGVPALALSAIWGRVKVVRRLLAAGADPGRAAGHQLTTALMVARNASCVRALIDAGADVNARRADGVNVIATVFHNSDATPPVKRALLEAGADPTVENHASHLCALDSHDPVDRALFVEFGFDPDERPGPRLDIEILLASVRAEAAQLGWEVPDDLSPRESRYTAVFELRPESTDGWTEDELARWREADADEQERIGTAVRERRRRRAIRVDVRTGAVTTHW